VNGVSGEGSGEGLWLGSEGSEGIDGVGGGKRWLLGALRERGVADGGALEGLLGGRDGSLTVGGEPVLLLRDVSLSFRQ
jgi:hypothetical protein